MTHIDNALAELAASPLPPQLAGIEAQVWQRLDAATKPAISWQLSAIAMALSLVVGIGTGLQPAVKVGTSDMDALSVRPALLPSTLLAAR